MKKLIKHLYRNTRFGHLLLNPIKNIQRYYYWHIMPEDKFLQMTFKEKLKYELDLKHPKTFNQKLQWLKLNDRRPLHTQCADKFAVRSHVEAKIGEEYLIPLLYVTKKLSDLTPAKMPEGAFVVKTNHDSTGGVVLVRDKTKQDWRAARKQLGKCLKRNYYPATKEWQYKNIKPCIVVEKMLLDENGKVPPDFKLHCFNGKLAFVQVDFDREKGHKRNLYDANWNLLDCKWKYPTGPDMPKPKQFKKMTELAEVFAQDFTYVRVDFYLVGEQIYFGELTFHSESGMGPFTPPEWDTTFGNMLKLPIPA